MSNGIEVTRQIRKLGDQTPIFILTAYDWADIEVEARAAGVTGFCSKPMFMSDLREALLNALGKQPVKEENVLPVTKETDERLPSSIGTILHILAYIENKKA